MPKLSLLEQPEQVAFDEGIEIFDYHLSESKKAGCYFKGDIKAITPDKPRITSKAEETALLAKKVGHYKTGSLYSLDATYNTAIARSNRKKCEAKAKSRVIEKILPASKIQEALKNGASNDQEVAEYCNVQVDYLCKAFEYYRTKGIEFYCCCE